MKKILTHLTGIAMVLAILLAGSCKPSPQPSDTPKNEDEPEGAMATSTTVEVFLKAVLIDEEIHLEMYDSNNSGCIAIDGLITDVDPGYDVKWKKAPNSNIRTIDKITFPKGHRISSQISLSSDSIFTLKVPSDIESDTIKYDIEFTTVKDGTHTIDPYLRIER